MKIIADLHLHSKYSRATSKESDLEHFSLAAQKKGVNLLGTGDFTHPQWFKELKEKLVPAEEGFYRLKNASFYSGSEKEVRFVVTGEISNIYQRGGQVRRVHNLIVLPSLEAAEKINQALSWQGNLAADGRPILGLDSEELLKLVLNLEPRALFIPAHIWTPWFAVFGSKSGFNSLEEAFGENTKYLAALETGLSSDPPMNWRISALDKFALVSNSDAHSPANIGREANVFDFEPNYENLRETILKKDSQHFLFTIEFFPEEGKYHYDGHRFCQVRMSPSERQKVQGRCPVCGKPLTIGVLSRVEELADRPPDVIPPGAIPFKKLVPLKEIIADVLNCQVKTRLVETEYQNLISYFSNEFFILLDAKFEELSRVTSQEIATAIIKVRMGQVILEPGYDGEYGKVKVNQELKQTPNQEALFKY